VLLLRQRRYSSQQLLQPLVFCTQPEPSIWRSSLPLAFWAVPPRELVSYPLPRIIRHPTINRLTPSLCCCACC
jgi:hypothetical protein